MQKASQYKIEEGSGAILRGKIWKNLSIFHGKLLKYKGVRQCSLLGRSVYFSMMVNPTLRHSVPPALGARAVRVGWSYGVKYVWWGTNLCVYQYKLISFYRLSASRRKLLLLLFIILVQPLIFYADYLNIGPAVMSWHV